MKKICIITGTRAEYGLLKPLIQKVDTDKELELQLVVTGMHLSPIFGNTIEEIKADGFKIIRKVECLLSSDTSIGISKSIALAISGFADVYEVLKPDLIVVLGDRTEILASVIAASMATIPIAHLYGGETTEGAYDEAIRHSITKFSHLHFSSTEVYRKRIIQLGENPKTVFNVGAIGLDSIVNLKLLTREEFEESINFKLNDRNILITYHPVTLEKESPKQALNNILRVVDEIDNTNIIFTHANSDKNGQIINKMIEEYVNNNRHKSFSIPSLGQLRYLSALQFVDVVVGNSSSGIVEVPRFNIPTINIGDRQKGRLMPPSVINCPNNIGSIREALYKAFNKSFLEEINKQIYPFGNGTASDQILNVIKNMKQIKIKKTFFDVDFKINSYD